MNPQKVIVVIVFLVSSIAGTAQIVFDGGQVLLSDYSHQLKFYVGEEDDKSVPALDDFQLNETLPKQGVVWIKLDFVSKIGGSHIFDFYRNDLVDVIIKQDSSSQPVRLTTGYMLPASRKQMQSWNAIEHTFIKGETYSVLIRLDNWSHLTDINITIDKASSWMKDLSRFMALDLGFLGLVLIMVLYHFFVYVISKEKAYFFLSGYLFFLLIFFLYATGVLRNYLFPEHPQWTTVCINATLIIPIFYYGFLKNFLNANVLIPKWNKVLFYMVLLDGVVFFVSMCIYYGLNNYQLSSRIAQATLAINIPTAILALVFLYRRRNELVIYFIAGSLVLLLAASVDIYYWDDIHNLGYFSRIGVIAEILLFSLGLGLKMRRLELEKHDVQQSYINQLVVNEKLIKAQKQDLETMVANRTKELEAAKNEAEEATKAKTEFLSVMSHEIRTPMNAIIGLTHLMKEEEDAEVNKENLQSLSYSAENLMLLIGDILDYSKIEAGKIELEEVDFDLRQLIDQMNSVFGGRARAKGIDFDVSIDSQVPTMVKGDPARLSQILNNFLSNAIKFTDKGLVKLELFVNLDFVKKSEIEFRVIDSGIGIAKDRITSVFEHFTQASKNITRKYGGTGLGLAIAQKLVRMMGGEILVESSEGMGSTFSFSLILDKAKDAGSKTLLASEVNEFDLSGLRVLIVDDNRMNRLVMEKFLKKWNVTTKSVASGKAAVKSLEEEEWDLVLLDIQMPEMDGYEVASTIRLGKSINKDLPIIAISADSITNVYDKILAVGMNDFVTKPFNPQELKRKIYLFCKSQQLSSNQL